MLHYSASSLALVATAFVAAASSRVEAQTRQAAAAEAGRLVLGEVVRHVLSSNPAVRLGAQQLEVERARLTASGAPFDLRWEMSMDGDRDKSPSRLANGGAFGSAVTERITSSASLQKQFRSGITVGPAFSLVRNDASVPAGLATSRASATLGVTVPLLRGRQGGLSTAGEHAAQMWYESGLAASRHTAAAAVRDAVTAYWDYAAAAERRAIFASSEQRAQRIADQTRELVARDERTPAELKQIQANVAGKRVTRISADQAVTEAQHRVGLAMGLPVASITLLSLPGTAFPEATAEELPPVDTLIAEALARRLDLVAATHDVRAAQVLREANQRELRPKVDLSVNVGYAGIEDGLGVNRYFAPLYRNVPGMSASVQLRYEAALTNAGARGRAAEASATLRQQQIARETAERRLVSDVVVAAEAVRRSRLGLTEAARGVALAETSVESEQQKFQLGMSTLFDVIQAEDALTQALLNRTTAHRGYAVALADLRYATGTLVRGDDASISVDPAALLTPPTDRR